MKEENRKNSLFGVYGEKYVNRTIDQAYKLALKRMDAVVNKLDLPEGKRKELSGELRQSFAGIWHGQDAIRKGTASAGEDWGRMGIRTEVQMTPGPVALNHGAKLKYSYNGDNDKHNVKARLGKTENARISGEIASGIRGDSTQKVNMMLGGVWDKGRGKEWNTGVEFKKKVDGYNIRAVAGAQKSDGNNVTPYGSFEVGKQDSAWEIRGGFFIKKDSKGSILEVKKIF